MTNSIREFIREEGFVSVKDFFHDLRFGAYIWPQKAYRMMYVAGEVIHFFWCLEQVLINGYNLKK